MPGAAWRIRSWLGQSCAGPHPGRDRGGKAGLAEGPRIWLVSLALGASLFVLDSFTLTDGAASVLYGGVLVILAEGRRWRVIVAAAGACVMLTALSYFPAHGIEIEGDGIFRRAVSLAAVAASAVLTLRNLIEQEKIDEQLQLLRLTNSALLVRGGDGLITYWSPGAERLYGWPTSEAAGQDARQLLRTELPETAEVEASLTSTGRWQGEVRQTARDGRRLIVAVSWPCSGTSGARRSASWKPVPT